MNKRLYFLVIIEFISFLDKEIKEKNILVDFFILLIDFLKRLNRKCWYFERKSFLTFKTITDVRQIDNLILKMKFNYFSILRKLTLMECNVQCIYFETIDHILLHS